MWKYLIVLLLVVGMGAFTIYKSDDGINYYDNQSLIYNVSGGSSIADYVITSESYEGSYIKNISGYEQIGENITLTSGEYEITFSSSINSTDDKLYYFSILKDGINIPLCERLIMGTGEPIIISLDCNTTITTTSNISLGVKTVWKKHYT